MKTFIVFIALVLVFSSLYITSSDMARYKQINITLKAIAEEIACGGGLMTVGTECTELLSINKNQAEKYAEFITEHAENNPLFSGGKLESEIDFDEVNQSIMATVTYTHDMLKNPISRKATYEWLIQNGK